MAASGMPCDTAFRIAGSVTSAIGAAVGRGIETFVNQAGRALESDRLPPHDHRPWKLPDEPWVMSQRWDSMLFAHWPLPPATLSRLVPRGLTLDTVEGDAWLGVTAFVVTRARLRGFPAVPGFASFPEVNVRTYVMADGIPGVLFLSLDAASVLAVLAARSWYRLPYFLTAARVNRRDDEVHFSSRRHHPQAPAATFVARYRGVGPKHAPAPDALVRWLTERYCLYTEGPRVLLRAEIHHRPWPIQAAEAVIEANTLADALGLTLGAPPSLTHFSPGVDAVVWPPRAVS